MDIITISEKQAEAVIQPRREGRAVDVDVDVEYVDDGGPRLQWVRVQADPARFDVWVSFRHEPVARDVDLDVAWLFVRALDAWDKRVGGEFMTWYTPAGKPEPVMVPPEMRVPLVMVPRA